MSLSAIPTDIVAPSRFDVGRLSGAALSATAFDFADLLISAQLQEATGLLSALPTAEGVASPTRVEAHRSVSVVGHVRTTIVSFTDGTTDVQTVTVDPDRRDVPIQAFPMSWTRIEAPIKANSDLEPEIGLGARRPSEDSMRGWKGRKAWSNPAIAQSGSFSRDRRPGLPAEDLATIDRADMGRLIDVLG